MSDNKKMSNESAFRDEVCRRINKRSIDLDINQVDLVKRLGVPKSTVNGWFTGITMPKGYTLVKLADVLRCSTEWLLAGRGQPMDAASGFSIEQFPGVWDMDENSPSPYYKVPSISPGSLKLNRDEVMLVSASRLSPIANKASIGWCFISSATSEPAISVGDAVCVDLSVKSVKTSGRYYAFSYGESISVHKTYINVDGSLSLEDAERPGSSLKVLPSEIKVIGLVFFGLGKL